MNAEAPMSPHYELISQYHIDHWRMKGKWWWWRGQPLPTSPKQYYRLHWIQHGWKTAQAEAGWWSRFCHSLGVEAIWALCLCGIHVTAHTECCEENPNICYHCGRPV